MEIGKLLKLDYRELKQINRIEKEFENLLKRQGSDYPYFIRFDVVYSHKNKEYEIRVKPTEGLTKKSTKMYFNDLFFSEESLDALKRFRSENNIGVIDY